MLKTAFRFGRTAGRICRLRSNGKVIWAAPGTVGFAGAVNYWKIFRSWLLWTCDSDRVFMKERLSSTALPLLLLLAMPLAANARGGRTATLLAGRLYCLSGSAVQDYIRAQNDPDNDRSRDALYQILWVRKVCDFTQAPIPVEIVQEGLAYSQVKVLTADLAWRNKSKVPWKGSVLYVKPGVN
jgi:hypothetical protein